ncbi:MAG TPA: hypothetical protein VN892_10085, partial [Solirubrobacteraceae bacterium]|nr:hypothetical protein [Solirubrobacteraceae bacterium]
MAQPSRMRDPGAAYHAMQDVLGRTGRLGGVAVAVVDFGGVARGVEERRRAVAGAVDGDADAVVGIEQV